MYVCTVPYRASAWQEAGPHAEGDLDLLARGAVGVGRSGWSEVGGRRRQRAKVEVGGGGRDQEGGGRSRAAKI